MALQTLLVTGAGLFLGRRIGAFLRARTARAKEMAAGRAFLLLGSLLIADSSSLGCASFDQPDEWPFFRHPCGALAAVLPRVCSTCPSPWDLPRLRYVYSYFSIALLLLGICGAKVVSQLHVATSPLPRVSNVNGQSSRSS